MASNATYARARFYNDAVLNPAKTAEANRPIFEDVEMVELTIPGDRLSRGVFLADEPAILDKETNTYLTRAQVYPDAYAAFKRGEQRAITGTPLEHWPMLVKSRVMELKALNILSVEELAATTDALLGRLGQGARVEREQARAWLESAKGSGEVQAQAAKIAQLEETLSKLLARDLEPAVAQQEEPNDRDVNDLTDEELKAYLKEKTGAAPRGNVSRETLISRVTEAAQAV